MKKLLFIVAITISVLATILDIVYRDQVIQTGNDFSVWLQKSRSQFQDEIFKIISYVALGAIFFLVAITILEISMNKGIKFLILVCQSVYIMGLLKMLYARPRPYWDDDQVVAVKCSKEFGNPSGHALLTLSSYGYFLFYVIKNEQGKNYLQVITFVVSVSAVGYDRVYLGVHYIWQVLLGWSYGFLLLVIAIGMSKKLGRILNNMLQNGWWTVLVQAALTTVQIILASLIYFYRPDDWEDTWTVNIKDKCGTDDDFDKSMNSCFVACFVVLLQFGAFLGRNLAASNSRLIYIMKEKKFKNYFIKYSLVFGTVGIGLILFLYVKSELNFLQLVIAMGVGEFLGGFILIWIIPKILCSCSQSSEKDSINPQLQLESFY